MENRKDNEKHLPESLPGVANGVSGRKCFCILVANTGMRMVKKGEPKVGGSTVELNSVHNKSWQNPQRIQV